MLTDGAFIRNPALQSVVMILMALIMGPLALVLLLACTNVTMLLLSRAVKRRGEIAVRLALGAGRARLVRMLALESFITAAAAGVVSIYLAARFPSFLFAVLDPAEGSAAASIQPDWKVFGFLAVLVLIATLASALLPLRESFRFDLISALKGREGAATMRSGTTGALIVAQLAMSFVLLAAAVLFARVPFMITHLDPGFETHQVMEFRLTSRFLLARKIRRGPSRVRWSRGFSRFRGCDRWHGKAWRPLIWRQSARFVSTSRARGRDGPRRSMTYRRISFLPLEFR